MSELRFYINIHSRAGRNASMPRRFVYKRTRRHMRSKVEYRLFEPSMILSTPLDEKMLTSKQKRVLRNALRKYRAKINHELLHTGSAGLV